MCHYLTYLGSLFVDVQCLLEFTVETRGNLKFIQFTDSTSQGTRFALKVISATHIVFEVRLSK